MVTQLAGRGAKPGRQASGSGLYQERPPRLLALSEPRPLGPQPDEFL